MLHERWCERGAECAFALLLLLYGSSYVAACSYSSNPKDMNRDFVVRVVNQEHLVSGLQIELSTDPPGDEESRTVAIMSTDSNGTARFVNVQPGLYFVGIKHPAAPLSEEIRVLSHPAKSTLPEIEFEWPGAGRTPLRVASVSGLLYGHARTDRGFSPDFSQPIFRPVPNAKLTLSKAVSNETVASEITHSSGEFFLGGVPAGDYFLHVETEHRSGMGWLYPSDGYVPIRVDPSATAPGLNLFLDQAICGALGYENRQGTDTINAQTH